jgi:putative membrane protein insertion efficiency factor
MNGIAGRRSAKGIAGQRDRAGRAPRAARAVAVAPIRFYQRLLSPLAGARCRYYPSCSEYAAQAIRRYGILRGLVLAGWRLLRCNPWSAGGVDLVEDQRLFGRRGTSAST